MVVRCPVLPDEVPDDDGACLGIPGITAHGAVFADGPVDGLTVLVHGALGGVGSLAAQLARWGGATVIGCVRRAGDLAHVNSSTVAYTVALDQPDPGRRHPRADSGGVDRIVKVALSYNIDLDPAVGKNPTVIALSRRTH